jgi:hypothetical protein
MPNQILVLRSGEAGKVPVSLAFGELALNYADGRLFYKTSDGQIKALNTGEEDLRWEYLKPPAPTSVSATAGTGQATVTWSAPTGNIGPAITDYIVEYSSDSGVTWTQFADGGSTLTSATVTGLTPSTSYRFRVAAVNGIGRGVFSSASSAVIPT